MLGEFPRVHGRAGGDAPRYRRATQVPHNPVRAYVMGEDAASERPSTPEERDQMAAIVAEGMASGALGFTTSRTKFHRTSTGEHVPSHFADLDEMRSIVQSLKKHGDGVIGLLCDFDEPEEDIAGFRQLAVESGRPLYYLLVQFDEHRTAGSRCWNSRGQARTAP